MPPLKAVMCARKPKAPGEGASAAPPAAPRLQNPAASKMLALVDSLEEELFAAEARRHDAEVGVPQSLEASPMHCRRMTDNLGKANRAGTLLALSDTLLLFQSLHLV